ncbi:hypothetical protein Acsp06_16830 [Actinomycetospora sp. NBRC 106375]|uniref:hypothetical protein n=1 Tax=Actinomycetospora sp. NBRC 106375 TaxID=3032207 RepID=UPI0024A2BAEB|nr:hypothetical protein [Actinomycetospora sp. NBRC 106375]GLZ45498.1 hypothetical protein Acsp06_16830 [Actinomycetospora sp. NBRC 106375]
MSDTDVTAADDPWLSLVRAHAAVVAVLVAVWAVLFALGPPGSGGGVNFGAAFASMPIEAVGQPWSLLGRAAFDRWGPTRSFAHDPVAVTFYELSFLGGAPLNLGLHALLFRWRRGRWP